jgi:hypothetical protein
VRMLELTAYIWCPVISVRREEGLQGVIATICRETRMSGCDT